MDTDRKNPLNITAEMWFDLKTLRGTSGRFTFISTSTKAAALKTLASNIPHTVEEDQGSRYDVWKEKPKIRVVTEPISRAVPSQSRDAKPERRDLCVGGM